MRFVDVTNDVAFRKIFGDEQKKIILISFLNAILGLEGLDRIKDVTLLNPYQFPRIIGERASIIDVKAVDEKDTTFIIEMQVTEPEGFAKRVLYYTCKDYSGQIKVGDQYPKLRPVYFIGILDFNFFEGTNYLSSHLIVDEQTGQCVFHDMKFRFLELPKFKKEIHELETIIDKWAYFLKNADELEVIPSNTDDEGLKEAYEAAAQHNWSREEYDAYIYAGMREQDVKGVRALAEKRAKAKGRAEGIAKGREEGIIKGREEGIAKGREEGIAKGRAEGIVKGREEGEQNERTRIILALFQNNIPTEMIAESVGLTNEEVIQIIKDYN